MALYKQIKQDDGVTTEYHRIISVTQTVNSHTSISVVSYVNEESRGNDIPTEGDNRPYRQAVTYELEYDESMNIENAYKYLKTLPQFEGAKDI